MADSGSLRVRRHRRHASGDHSLCRRDCASPGPVALLPESGSVDAHAELEALARRLVTAHEADPGSAAVARELRATLAILAGLAPAADDPLEGLRELAARVP
jgi:hypothetical protein